MYESKRNGRNQVHFRALIDEPERKLAQSVLQIRFSRWLVNRKVFDIPTISNVLSRCRFEHQRIGEIAQQLGFLDQPAVDQILADQEPSGERFGAIALRLGLLDQGALVYLLGHQQESPLVLAKSLVQQGLLEKDYAHALLHEYRTEHAPPKNTNPAASESVAAAT